MPQVRVLSTGARITGGVFCLLFAVHTWAWVIYDVAELGLGGAWDLWTGFGAQLESMPATTSIDIGLGVLQLAAVFAAFTASWSAGGLLAVTSALTFAYRLPAIWGAAEHSEYSPWFRVRDFYDDATLEASGTSAAWIVLFAFALGIVLVAGIRAWPRAARGVPGWDARPEPPLPSETPQRPTGPAAAVMAVFLGGLCAFQIGWSIRLVTVSGGHVWKDFLLGEGVVHSLLDVPPAWRWLVLAALCGTGALLAVARVPAARGFALALALVVLPSAVATLWQYVESEMLFELGEVAAVANFFGRLELAFTLVGAFAVIALAVRPGVPVTLAAPAGPPPFVPQFGGGYPYPAPPVQAPPGPSGPAAGGPPQGPPAGPQAGPPAAGGFGPPPGM